MKWNVKRSWTPNDFNRRTTLAKFVLWISGTEATSNSSLYCLSVYSLEIITNERIHHIKSRTLKKKKQYYHLNFVEELPEAMSRPSSTCTPWSLVGVGLRDGEDLESVHADTWVEHFQFAIARIDHEEYAINCEDRKRDFHHQYSDIDHKLILFSNYPAIR